MLTREQLSRNLGTNLERERFKLGYSQQDMAKALRYVLPRTKDLPKWGYRKKVNVLYPKLLYIQAVYSPTYRKVPLVSLFWPSSKNIKRQMERLCVIQNRII